MNPSGKTSGKFVIIPLKSKTNQNKDKKHDQSMAYFPMVDFDAVNSL